MGCLFVCDGVWVVGVVWVGFGFWVLVVVDLVGE